MGDYLHTVTTVGELNDGIGETEAYKSANSVTGIIPRDDAYALDSGVNSMSRLDINSTGILTTTGVRFSYFTCVKAFTATQMRMICGGTAAGATPTLVRMGLYTVASDGALTRVAATVSDTALFGTINTAVVKAFAASYAMVEGQAYAAALLVTSGAALPTVVGHALTSTTDLLVAPRIAGVVVDTDLAASYTGVSIGVSAQRAYHSILP